MKRDWIKYKRYENNKQSFNILLEKSIYWYENVQWEKQVLELVEFRFSIKNT